MRTSVRVPRSEPSYLWVSIRRILVHTFRAVSNLDVKRDWTAWKDRMYDAQLLLPTERPDGIARFFCGETITSAATGTHVLAAHRAIGA
jgi:hypothetical protein